MLELHIHADKSGDPLEDGTWPIAGLEIIGETPEYHNFADTVVAKGIDGGYLRFEDMTLRSSEGYDRNPVLSGSAIVLDTVDGEVHYEVLESPGKYADESEPSGIRVTHEYRTRLQEG